MLILMRKFVKKPLADSSELLSQKSDIVANNNKKENQKVIALHVNPEDLDVFITKDPQLLQQYYTLRHDAYRNDNGWADYMGVENDFDRQGHIVVAVNKNSGEVLGGIRLMFSDECRTLSNEIPGTQFEYKQVLRRFNRISADENVVMSEFSALVVHPRYRDNTITSSLIQVIFSESEKHDCDYFFAVAQAISCRSYRMASRRYGYEFEIVINYPWKEKRIYNFDPMFPMYVPSKGARVAS